MNLLFMLKQQLKFNGAATHSSVDDFSDIHSVEIKLSP